MNDALYLAGPMAGYDQWNYPAFEKAAADWRAYGWEVLSPTENFQGKTDLPRPTYLRAAMRQVCRADAVACLPGWTASRGAVLECLAAAAFEIPIYDAEKPFCSDQPRTGTMPDARDAFRAIDPFGEYLQVSMEQAHWLPNLIAQGYSGEDGGESVLIEAERLINGPRQAAYSHPMADFLTTANFWTTYMERRGWSAFEPEDVAMMMILLKISRETHKHKRDSLVDIAGYAGCLQMVHAWKANH